jgi:hypothetical protein
LYEERYSPKRYIIYFYPSSVVKERDYLNLYLIYYFDHNYKFNVKYAALHILHGVDIREMKLELNTEKKDKDNDKSNDERNEEKN